MHEPRAAAPDEPNPATLHEVSVTVRFLDLGGQAGHLCRRVLDRFGVALSLATRLEAETIEAMAALVVASLVADAEPARRESLLEDLGR